MASSQSAVTITLNLRNQKETIAGLQATTDAVRELQTAVEDADAAISASSKTMAGDVTAAYDTAGTAAEDAAGRLSTANDAAIRSNEELAVSAEDTAAKVSASYDTMNKSSVEANAAATKATASKSEGLLGMLTSLKTLAIGGAAYESIKSFSNYQAALTKLGTIAGLTAKQIGQVNSAIQSSAVKLRTSPTALANAYYNPISEGFGVAGSNQVVARAAQLANMTGSPLTGQDGTSYALSTMLQTYGMKPTASNVLRMAAMIRGGVSTGDMSLNQLLAANSTGYFNAAKSYGINEQSAMSNLDFFSSQGVSPQSAATRMRETLAMMAAPSQQADKYLTTMGLTTTQVSGIQGQLAALGLNTTTMSKLLRGPNGINNAVSAVVNASQGMNPEMREALYAKLFGGGRTESTFLTLANHPQLAQQMYNRVGANSTTGGYNAAWSKYNTTLDAQLKTLEVSFEKLGLEVGKDLIPVLDAVVKVLNPFLKFASSPVGAAAITTALVGGGVYGGAKIFGKLGSYAGEAYGSADSGLASIFQTGIFGTNLQALGQASKDTGESMGKLSLRMAKLSQTTQTAEGIATTAATAQADLGKAELGAGEKAAGAETGLAGFSKILLPLAAMYYGGKLLDKGQQQKGVVGGFFKSLSAPGTPLGADSQLPGVVSGFLKAFENPSGKNIKNALLGPMEGALSKLGIHLASGGFMTSHPTAIVGEGSRNHPEFVVPTDPIYRSRALGLYASLGTHLMADGGTLGTFNPVGNAFGAMGTGASLLSTLSMLTSGNTNGAVGSMLRSMTGPGAAQLPSSAKTVEAAIRSSVPGGPLQQFMLALSGTVLADAYQDTMVGTAAGSVAGAALSKMAAGGTFPSIPVGKYDVGGYLPEGLSLAINNTGKPEHIPGPNGSGRGSAQPLIVTVEVDSKEIGRTVIKDIRRTLARS